MSENAEFRLYRGNGITLKDRKLTLPEYDFPADAGDPAGYIAGQGLQDAVNVALALGQPLLVTGEPGTGKTCLAAAIAWELGLELFTFHTKTTSTATDLFYHYDALRRFQDIQLKERHPIKTYITCRALGQAILLANPTDKALQILPQELKGLGPQRSVVLVDEIDKAPRDLPNDLLDEVEHMRFEIKETTWPPFEADPRFRPIVVLTSNSEKNLPEAFLRRCVYYHIEFPDDNALKRIVARRFKAHQSINGSLVQEAVAHFNAIRELDLKKKPSTAEFLAWLSILATLGVENLGSEQREKIRMSYTVLAKSREDLALITDRGPGGKDSH